MIIVEGFDCSGKSTLATLIGQELGWEVLHPGGPTKDEGDVYSCLLRSLSRMRKRCVQDRVTHISESVYSMLKAPEKAVLALNAMRDVCYAEMIVYCRPPTEVMLESLRTHVRKEHETQEHVDRVLEEAPTLIRLYDTIMTLASIHAGVRLIKHDRTKPDDTRFVLNVARSKFK